MTNVSGQLFQAGRSRGTRGSDVRRKLLSAVAATVPGELEWDDEAGEDWATLFRRDKALVYIATALPIVVVLEQYRDQLDLGGQSAEIISVSDMDARELSASWEALTAAFGNPGFDSEFDPDQFSANELYYWTV